MRARRSSLPGRAARYLAPLFLTGIAAAVLVFGWPAWRRAADDPPYAAHRGATAGPAAPRPAPRSHRNSPSPAGPEGSSAARRGHGRRRRGRRRPPAEAGWEFAWGASDWRPTPAAPLGDTTRDALDACAPHFDRDTTARLTAALAAPGSWYVRDAVGETLHVWSAGQGVAARIRYGD